MPGASHHAKAAQAEVYGIFPRLKFTGFAPGTVPTPKGIPSTSPLDTQHLTTAEQNSFQSSLAPRQPAPLLDVLPILYPIQPSWNFSQQSHTKLLPDLKIRLGFLQMTQPLQTFVSEFLVCTSFLETHPNAVEHFGRGF